MDRFVSKSVGNHYIFFRGNLIDIREIASANLDEVAKKIYIIGIDRDKPLAIIDVDSKSDGEWIMSSLKSMADFLKKDFVVIDDVLINLRAVKAANYSPSQRAIYIMGRTDKAFAIIPINGEYEMDKNNHAERVFDVLMGGLSDLED